jgi:two-component system, OmpR family, response regulator
LLVDHDDAEAEAWAVLLKRSGLEITISSSLEAGSMLDPGEFEAIVLGVNGRVEGAAARCRELRERGYFGAVIGICSDVGKGQALLDAGADDFVTRPFEPMELVTRIRACVRRSDGRSRLRWGLLELDRVRRVLRVHGRDIELTTRESALLSCLIEAGGRVVSRADLRERVWQRRGGAGSNLVEVHLSRLRDKLAEDAPMIETVRGAGYKLRR